jgi:hypothetical protein
MKLYVLIGKTPKGYAEQLFSDGERATALAIAKKWDEKGWKPKLTSQTYDGNFRTVYNWKTRAVKKAAA